jgi:polysaccharide biosynthesis protein PslH
MPKPSGGSEAAALMLAPEAPYPMAGGGALRTASLVEYLRARGGVDLVVFDQPGGPQLPRHSRSLAARAWRNLSRAVRRVPPLVDRFSGFPVTPGRKYPLIVVEHFWCAPYVRQLREFADHLVLDLHNVESVFHARCATSSRWPSSALHGVFAAAARRLEEYYLPEFDHILVTSERDREFIREFVDFPRIIVYPNTIPLVSLPELPEEEMIAFSGNFEYQPNAEGIRWFRSRIWPVLARRHPDLEWRLIGRNPPRIEEPRVRTTGPVDDAIRELARAKIAVVPLLAGSGTRFKILEAWAAGRAVISTTVGAEGLPLRDQENALIADSAGEFADAITRLLQSDPLRRRLGNAGRDVYVREYTWQSGWEQLDRAGFCSP